jgi:hypothetical protein
LLGYFSAKVGREDIFQPTAGNESLQKKKKKEKKKKKKVNFAISAKSTIFPHKNIHKFTCTSPDWKTPNLIDHAVIDRQRHLSVLDV